MSNKQENSKSNSEEPLCEDSSSEEDCELSGDGGCAGIVSECSCGRMVCEGHERETSCCGCRVCPECIRQFDDYDILSLCEGTCEQSFLIGVGEFLYRMGWSKEDLDSISRGKVKSISRAEEGCNQIGRMIRKKIKKNAQSDKKRQELRERRGKRKRGEEEQEGSFKRKKQ